MQACHARHADHEEACHDRGGGGGATNHLKQSKEPGSSAWRKFCACSCASFSIPQFIHCVAFWFSPPVVTAFLVISG
jgi:hypothetical protein